MRDERAFIANQKKWPLWPILPVKSRKLPFLDPNYCAVIHASNPTRVHYGNIFERRADAGFKDYPDIDALLAEYQVD